MNCVKKLLQIAYNDVRIQAFLRQIKELRYETYIHSLSVASLSAILGCQMKLSDDEIIDLIKGALLHDYGKIYIAEDILLKPSTLSEAEYEIVKDHSLFGYNIVKNYFNDNISAIVRDHHEKLNGIGYPFGEQNISLLTQIVTVCDIYDALTKRDTYKELYNNSKAFKILYADANRGEINANIIDVLSFVARQKCDLWLWDGIIPLESKGGEEYGIRRYAN